MDFQCHRNPKILKKVKIKYPVGQKVSLRKQDISPEKNLEASIYGNRYLDGHVGKTIQFTEEDFITYSYVSAQNTFVKVFLSKSCLVRMTYLIPMV